MLWPQCFSDVTGYPLKKVSSLHLAPSQIQCCFTAPWICCCSFRTSPSTPLQGTSGPCCARSCRSTWHIPVPREGAWQPISTTPSASPTPRFWSPLPRSSGPSSPRWVPGTFPGGCSWELWQFTPVRQGWELQHGPSWAGVAHLCTQVQVGHSESELILVHWVSPKTFQAEYMAWKAKGHPAISSWLLRVLTTPGPCFSSLFALLQWQVSRAAWGCGVNKNF